jgi:hypothetical protein
MDLRRLVTGIVVALLVAVGLLGWMSTPAYTAGKRVAAIQRQSELPPLRLEGPEGWTRRRDMLRRATFDYTAEPQFWPPLDACSFVADEPSGTTSKFDCLFANGEVLKVKYSRGPEPYAEVAATTLLKALGYGADHVTFTPRLRCHGCPRYPFIAMHIASQMRALGLPPPALTHLGYTDFEWVSVERRLQLREVETPELEGWSWWELRRSQAPRAELDAFKLLAVFLGHWDNKATNQRLVCRDETCDQTLAIMQDVGATFGPTKVNLAAWRREPIWADRARCRISMSRLPFSGATFEDTVVSEEGRLLLLDRLSGLSREQVREIFRAARFPAFHAGTDDRRDLDAWVNAFEYRVSQIAQARCKHGA